MKCLFSFSPERDDDTVAAATLTEFQRSKIKHLDSDRTAGQIRSLQNSDI